MSGSKAQIALGSMLQDHLASNGQDREATAFGRWFNKPLGRFAVDQRAVGDARKNLSSMLRKVRSQHAVTTIEPRRRKGDSGDTVVVISLDELARTLGAVAAEVESSSAARGGDPMKMFVAVDRLPEVEASDAIVEHKHPARHQELDLG